jgi:hypothetical protein
MRVLTVRQPWAWAIIHGGKDVENRTRNLAGDYRGPVAIHVATACPLLDDETRVSRLVGRSVRTMKSFAPVDGGHIIGVVDLVAVVDGREPSPKGVEVLGESPWADPDMWHLYLTNPRPLREPIPYRGGLGLRHLPDNVEHMVTKGLDR